MSEADFIRWLYERFDAGDPAGPGDDCATLADGTLVTTDSILEGVEFAPETEPRAAGYKAAAVSLSDIAAMGGRAEALFCAAVLGPRHKTAAEEIVKGLLDACRPFGVRLAGGDYSSWNSPTVLVTTAVGRARRAVPRSGARVGQLLCTTGVLGGSILGKHLRFTPRLREGAAIAACGASAMIDISDGLAADAERLAEASGAGVVIDAEAVPVSAAARVLSERDGRTPLEHALADGEDFELLFCADEADVERLRRLRTFAAPVFVVGRVTEKRGLWLARGENVEPLEASGWLHD